MSRRMTTLQQPHFYLEFAKQSKEFMDQVKAIISSLQVKTKREHSRKPFSRASSSKRGGAKQGKRLWQLQALKLHPEFKAVVTPAASESNTASQTRPTIVCTSVTCTYIKPCVTMYTDDHCSHVHKLPQHSRYTECTSRTAKSLPQKLGGTNQGPLGPRNSDRLPNRLSFGTHPTMKTTPSSIQPESNSTRSTRRQRTSKEMGSSTTTPAVGWWYLLHPVSGPKGWWPETGDKLESSKHLCSSAIFQDGGYSHTKKNSCNQEIGWQRWI